MTLDEYILQHIDEEGDYLKALYRDPRAIHSPSSSTIKEAAAGKSIRRVNSGLDVFIVDIPFHVPNPISKVALLFAQAFRAYYSHFAENVHS